MPFAFLKRKSGKAPRVSVLVPVYNTERFLPRCLESLTGQTLRDIEIIAINDGSTDSSPDILEKFASRDPRIKVIDKENSGFGASLNIGLSQARGEYIGFCDSDDFASPDMFERYYSYAKRHRLDLVRSNYLEHRDGADKMAFPFEGFEYHTVFDPADNPWVLTVMPALWSSIIRRSMLDDEWIRFNETPGASYQDTGFSLKCWIASRRAALLPEGYLHYRLDNEDSSVRSSGKVFAVCGEYASVFEFLGDRPERAGSFSAILTVAKYNTYIWNYNRITDDCKLPFAKQASREYREHQEKGILERSLFDSHRLEMIDQLIDDPARFVEMNPVWE